MRQRVLILGTSHTGITLARKIVRLEGRVDFMITDDLLIEKFDKYFVLHDEDGANVKLILFIKANYKDAKVYTVLS